MFLENIYCITGISTFISSPHRKDNAGCDSLWYIIYSLSKHWIYFHGACTLHLTWIKYVLHFTYIWCNWTVSENAIFVNWFVFNVIIACLWYHGKDSHGVNGGCCYSLIFLCSSCGMSTLIHNRIPCLSSGWSLSFIHKIKWKFIFLGSFS